MLDEAAGKLEGYRKTTSRVLRPKGGWGQISKLGRLCHGVGTEVFGEDKLPVGVFWTKPLRSAKAQKGFTAKPEWE